MKPEPWIVTISLQASGAVRGKPCFSLPSIHAQGPSRTHSGNLPPVSRCRRQEVEGPAQIFACYARRGAHVKLDVLQPSFGNGDCTKIERASEAVEQGTMLRGTSSYQMFATYGALKLPLQLCNKPL